MKEKDFKNRLSYYIGALVACIFCIFFKPDWKTPITWLLIFLIYEYLKRKFGNKE